MIPPSIDVQLDRQAPRTLTEQIHSAIARAIREGRLQPGARLPSWRDLSVQLGVSRGTVRAAYERLADSQMISTRGVGGTFVTDHLPVAQKDGGPIVPSQQAPIIGASWVSSPILFRMGIPAQDLFPAKLWARLIGKAARSSAGEAMSYPDAMGLAALRQAIAAYLAIARGVSVDASQIYVTNGYAGALGLLLHACGMTEAAAWVEDPGYPLTRLALETAGVRCVSVPVDAEGLMVEVGIKRAPSAAFAFVTPGQQAPLGTTMSLRRRRALLDWAEDTGAWIVEDDYLGDLQLEGRAAPALASIDLKGNVIHVGSFSKTIHPALRLGFIVVPPGLVDRCRLAAASLAPAQGPVVQAAVTAFLEEGHHLRHLRRMKRAYAARRDMLLARLRANGIEGQKAGLAVLLPLSFGLDDVALADAAQKYAMSPMALSRWNADPTTSHKGLLLNVTNVAEKELASRCEHLAALVRDAESE